MKLLRLAKFNDTYVVNAGDVFNLIINGKIVHTTPILPTLQTINCYAVVEVPGGMGYFVGNDDMYNYFNKLYNER